MKKKLLKGIIGAFLVFIFIGVVYAVPVQRYYSEKKLEHYLASQHISVDSIKSKKAKCDFYKNGGYVFTIRYKSDPSYEYVYAFPARNLDELKHGEAWVNKYKI